MSATSNEKKAAPRGGLRKSLFFWTKFLPSLRRFASKTLIPIERAWMHLRPPQQLVLGFLSYAVVGVLLLWLPVAQSQPCRFIDNLFNVVSAISTTGLTTISVGDCYSWFGEFVILCLFQLGGIGYMTLSSVIMLARGKNISEQRMGVLKAGFALPHYFVVKHFIVHVVVFTFACELIGTLILWWRFSALGVEQPLWSAAFHSVSAFCTAGFSLNNDSLERFTGDWIVNLTITFLCYFGAIGFIVVQDAWYSAKWRERALTFTSKVILAMTGLVLVLGTVLFYILEPTVREQPFALGLLQSAFQVMTASTTAGFNTIPISHVARGALLIIMIAMLIGASPSGTGGGLKTTTVSALLGTLMSVIRGRDRVLWLNREIPMLRVIQAVGVATIYLLLLAVGVLCLSVTERTEFLQLVFEAASAIGTVGLSMGITGELTIAGKLIIIVLMFAGRCGPLTLGLALLRPEQKRGDVWGDDLAV